MERDMVCDRDVLNVCAVPFVERWRGSRSAAAAAMAASCDSWLGGAVCRRARRSRAAAVRSLVEVRVLRDTDDDDVALLSMLPGEGEGDTITSPISTLSRRPNVSGVSYGASSVERRASMDTIDSLPKINSDMWRGSFDAGCSAAATSASTRLLSTSN